LTGNTLPAPLDLLRLFLLQPRPDHISVGGHVQVVDAPEPHPVTFTSGRAYIRVAAPWNASDGGRLEFHFRTVEPTGLALYGGEGRNGGSVGVELFDGRLYVNVDDGGRSGFRRFLLDARSGRVDDGLAHHVVVELVDGEARMTLDGAERVETLRGPVDLRGAEVLVGGVDDASGGRLPWHAWTRDGPPWYRGCVWSLRFDGGGTVDLAGLAADGAGIEVGCRTMPNDCRPDTCHNDGVCSQSWVGPVCDCSRTAFTGRYCQQGSFFNVAEMSISTSVVSTVSK